MIAALLAFPLGAAALILAIRSRALTHWLLRLYPAFFLASAACLALRPDSFTSYFRADRTNILFLIILAVVYGVSSFYILPFLRREVKEQGMHTALSVSLLLFIFSMTGVILSTHLGLLWVFVEATTLSSAVFIIYERTKSAIEASWKYVFICSIGIALAFLGIIFLAFGLRGTDKSLFFSDLLSHAGDIDPFWLKVAFPFFLVGFGTKAGLAPMHAWLPDAHSEAPAPISALLSGMLLNTALLGIIRICTLMRAAGFSAEVRTLLFAAGFLSLFICAVYVFKIKNYKRMLAYSSVEHMGIIMIGIACGGSGITASGLHLISHSLAKSLLFLTSGMIYARYHTKMISEVRGILSSDPGEGWMWMLGFFFIAGFPPSPLFISEFLIARSLFEQGFYILFILFFLLTTVVLYGMGSVVLSMVRGREESPGTGQRPSSFLVLAPRVFLLLALATLGLWIPEVLRSVIEGAVL
jgi:hydrogenase-4 component F